MGKTSVIIAEWNKKTYRSCLTFKDKSRDMKKKKIRNSCNLMNLKAV